MTNHQQNFTPVRSTGKFLRFLYPLLAALFVVTIFSGCRHREMVRMFNFMTNGKSITLSVGENIAVRLIANPKAGGAWEIVQCDQKIVSCPHPARVSCQIPVGGLARMYDYDFMFHGESVGSTVVKMQVMDLDNKEVIDTYSVTMIVKEGPFKK